MINANLPDGWVQVKTSFYNELVANQNNLVAAASDLLLLITNFAVVYDSLAAKKLTESRSFIELQAAIGAAEERNAY